MSVINRIDGVALSSVLGWLTSSGSTRRVLIAFHQGQARHGEILGGVRNEVHVGPVRISESMDSGHGQPLHRKLDFHEDQGPTTGTTGFFEDPP